MSGSKHTPGPWEWFTKGAPDVGGMQMKLMKSAGGQGFAHTVGLPEPEDTANANILIASVDLLEACEGITELLESNVLVRNVDGDGDPGWAIKAMPLVLVLKKMSDAIAKARGAS